MFILCSASLAGTAVSTLANSSFNPGIERAMLAAAGNHQAEFAAVMRSMARGTVTTRKINALTSYALGASNLVFRNVAQGGVGSSTYVSLAGGATSLVVPRRLSWNAGSPAQLTAEIIFLSANGTTAPVTVGSTAGSLTAEADVWVGAGTGVYMIEVDFGIEISIPQDGHLYPINAFIMREHPSIRIGTYDEAAITQANIQPGSISSLTATFAKIADGGVRGAETTYTVSGHLIVDPVTGAKPGTVVKTCQAEGGITIA